MATKIRLQRHGKKGKPFFHLVAADSRAKRDGKFIEKLGIYNPTANPAIIDIDFDNTLKWVQTGAEMTNTARAILSYKGVLYKNHLLNGVLKGALTAEQVEERFAKWISDKESKIQNKKDGLAKNAVAEKIAKQKAEEVANAAKAAEVAAKNVAELEEVITEEPEAVAEESISEESAEEAPVAESAEEAPVAESTEEAPVAESTEEAPVAESTEEAPVAESTEEAPVAEPTEETPAAESTEEESAE
jgi:small subunit ribosomal protein S16